MTQRYPIASDIEAETSLSVTLRIDTDGQVWATHRGARHFPRPGHYIGTVEQRGLEFQAFPPSRLKGHPRRSRKIDAAHDLIAALVYTAYENAAPRRMTAHETAVLVGAAPTPSTPEPDDAPDAYDRLLSAVAEDDANDPTDYTP